MTYLTISTASNKQIAEAHRPAAILPRPGSLIRSILPSSNPHMTLTINLLNSWIPGTSQGLMGTLEIGRKDSWKSIGTGEGRELTVLEAHVTANVKLQGTRRIVGAYPNVAAIISSGAFFVTSILGLLLCFWRYTAPFEGVSSGRSARGRPLPPTGMMPALERPPRMSDRDDGSVSTARILRRRTRDISPDGSSVTVSFLAFTLYMHLTSTIVNER